MTRSERTSSSSSAPTTETLTLKTPPVRYHERYEAEATKYAKLGLDPEQMAGALEIPLHVLKRWIKTKPAFKRALLRGGVGADAEVAEALYKRAVGFHETEVVMHKVDGEDMPVEISKYHPPDTNAAKTWLAVRQADKWREVKKTDVTHKGKIAHDHRAIQAAEAFLGRVLDVGPGGGEEDTALASEERPLLPPTLLTGEE